jgi:hypothetical protein
MYERTVHTLLVACVWSTSRMVRLDRSPHTQDINIIFCRYSAKLKSWFHNTVVRVRHNGSQSMKWAQQFSHDHWQQIRHPLASKQSKCINCTTAKSCVCVCVCSVLISSVTETHTSSFSWLAAVQGLSRERQMKELPWQIALRLNSLILKNK